MRYTKYLIISFIFLLFIPFFFFYTDFSKDHLRLQKTSFTKLKHWKNDNHLEALNTFQNSCTKILAHNPHDIFAHSLPHSGQYSDWQEICKALENIPKNNTELARKFFEAWFVPYKVKNNFYSKGLFTGYYLPEISASFKKDKKYHVPIYGVPKDLVKVNLGLFNPTLKGKKIIGRLNNNILYPYPERKIINKENFNKDAPVLLWANNPVDVFFAQIQGSALVQLPNHTKILIGYAESNGQPYTAIGKVLLEQKALLPNNVTMQSIRDWLAKHPEKIQTILNHDASYVFFRLLNQAAPLGAQGIPLTASRSLAIDLRYLSLGLPIWLKTTIPDVNSTKKIPFHQLMIAQDTGGAIRGVVRGDVYWGEGEKAAKIAGQMQSKGQYWILLPRKHSF